MKKLMILIIVLLATMTVSNSAFACDGKHGFNWSNEFVFVASHPSARCFWTWGDSSSKVVYELPDAKNFEEAQEVVAKLAKQLEGIKNAKTKDRNGDGKVDWFEFDNEDNVTLHEGRSIPSGWILVAVGSEKHNMLFGSKDSNR